MTGAASRLATVIVNHATPAATSGAVRGLRRLSPDGLVLVVDNGSPITSLAVLARDLSGADLLRAGENRGFAAGCNLGIREALSRGYDRVLLLNSDAQVTEDAVTTLSAAIESQPDIGIAGALLVSAEPVPIVESAGIRYMPSTGRMRHLAYGQPAAEVDAGRIRMVDAVSGCAMLVRREVFDAIGLLDEAYFFGFEDLDFCLRAGRAGWRTVCVQGAIVRHAGSATIGRGSPRRLYFATMNHLRIARTPAGGQGWMRPIRTVFVLALNLGYALRASEIPRVAGVRAWLSGARDYFAGP